ncbi:twin-arginine translocation signal domain-containing protein [Haliea sp. E17]|uniref:twin-arginine translocation signal domain-containing protein n=1 Tax=Haliea sp. E17 TaxID=3401576 RepID=UPI003AAFF9EC
MPLEQCRETVETPVACSASAGDSRPGAALGRRRFLQLAAVAGCGVALPAMALPAAGACVALVPGDEHACCFQVSPSGWYRVAAQTLTA